MKKKLFFSLSLISCVGIATALPILVLGLTGRRLDLIYSSSPKLFIMGITIAALASFYILRSITTKAIKTLSEETK